MVLSVRESGGLDPFDPTQEFRRGPIRIRRGKDLPSFPQLYSLRAGRYYTTDGLEVTDRK
jgi:hypothetical protein